MYINDLLDNLTSAVKLFADHIVIVSIVKDPYVTAKKLNKDLKLVSELEHKLKKLFSQENNLSLSILSVYLVMSQLVVLFHRNPLVYF